MASTPRAPAPAWARRIQGWSFLVFFVSLIVLTFVAVEFWNARNFEMSGYFAGLASAVPLLLVLVIYYALPVWGVSVPLAPDAVAGALEAAAAGRRVEPVAEREGPFARCAAVVRFEAPSCTVGWFPETVPASGVAEGQATIVILRPESRDRRGLAALRASLAESLAAASQPSA